MRFRSPREIVFRLHQEARNLRLKLAPPSPELPDAPPALLPAGTVECAAASRYAEQVERVAAQVCRHVFPILGIEIETGPEIAWRRDFLSGRESDLRYFRRIPYLNAAAVGDHKVIWELNRHQHLVALAQAYRLTHTPGFLNELAAQLESWWNANPFLLGINWTSALEVAFRALSWIWIDHLAGAFLKPGFRRRFRTELYRHGCFLEANLSVYFSPNTHLLGEALALHALGAVYPSWPGASEWRRTGARILEQQAAAQVRPDGSHFEQSTYYHVYALDMLLLHFALGGGRQAGYRATLERMAHFLDAILGAAGEIDNIGDDDGGRLFHPYGNHRQYGRATLSTCGVIFGRPEWIFSRESLLEQALWWLGPEALRHEPARRAAARSCRFPDSGLAVLCSGDIQVLVDTGGFGPASAGHSHSDTLSITARSGAGPILIDAGTYTYVGDPRWRNWFRGSAAHNTLRIDGLDQADPAGPFRWSGRPEVELLAWKPGAGQDHVAAQYSARGITHRRYVWLLEPGILVVLDQVEGPPGEHQIEQFWHLHGAEHRCRIAFWPPRSPEWSEDGEHAWMSDAFGRRQHAPVFRITVTGALPAIFLTAVDLRLRPGSLRLAAGDSKIRISDGSASYSLDEPIPIPADESRQPRQSALLS